MSDRKAGLELGFRVDGKDQSLRRMAAAFSLFGAGLVTPVFAGGTDGSGGAGGLIAHSVRNFVTQREDHRAGKHSSGFPYCWDLLMTPSLKYMTPLANHLPGIFMGRSGGLRDFQAGFTQGAAKAPR